MLKGVVLAACMLAANPARSDPFTAAAPLGRGVNAFGYDPAWSNPAWSDPAAPPPAALFAYDKAPTGDRARWTAAVARAAEARGISWTYWQFDHDFAAYDRTRDAWITPIHDALIPPNQ